MIDDSPAGEDVLDEPNNEGMSSRNLLMTWTISSVPVWILYNSTILQSTLSSLSTPSLSLISMTILLITPKVPTLVHLAPTNLLDLQKIDVLKLTCMIRVPLGTCLVFVTSLLTSLTLNRYLSEPPISEYSRPLGKERCYFNCPTETKEHPGFIWWKLCMLH